MKSLKLFFALVLVFISARAFAEEKKAAPGAERWKQIISDVEQYAQKGMKELGVPGMAVGIVQGDEVIYTKGFGVKAAGENSAVTTDTIFQIGSTSKAFTACVAAMLQDEGKFNWDEPVTRYLPDFAMYDPWVTREFEIWDMMAQHSGLPGYSADFLASCGFDRNRIIQAIRYIKPVTSFRSKYAYQNHMFLAAASLEEKLSGKTWEENVRERIFKPLGMESSSTGLASFRDAKDVAWLHVKVKDKVTAVPMDWKYMHWVYTYGPAGGINSNITDMLKWLKLQINEGSFGGKQLVSKENIRFLQTPKTILGQAIGGRQAYYCQGWLYMESDPYPVIWHNGGTTGMKTMVAFVPQAKVGIVILSNLITEFPEDLAFRFFDNYFGLALKDNITKMKEKEKKETDEALAKMPKAPEHPCAAMPLEQYAGEYENDVYGKINVVMKDKGLSILIGPLKSELKLTHFDKNDFQAVYAVLDLTETPSFVRFNAEPDGALSGLTIEAINEDGCGVFEKVRSKE